MVCKFQTCHETFKLIILMVSFALTSFMYVVLQEGMAYQLKKYIFGLRLSKGN